MATDCDYSVGLNRNAINGSFGLENICFIFHVTKLKQIFAIIGGSKNNSLTTVSYIYSTVPFELYQDYALQSVQCTVKIERVKTIHCATGQFLGIPDYLA